MSQQAAIGPDNDLAMNKRQTNIWTKDDPIHVCFIRPQGIKPNANMSDSGAVTSFESKWNLGRSDFIDNMFQSWIKTITLHHAINC